MTAKTPIRTVFNESGTATGLAEYQTGEFVPVEHGGLGVASLSQNSVLLGSGTDAVRSSAIQIEGSVISSSDSTIIQIADGLTVTGDLTVTGTTTTVNSSTINVTNSFTFEGSTSDDFETTLTVTDPTADRTITLPNATGTVSLLDNTETLTNKTISGSSNTLSNIATSSITFSGSTISGITSLSATTLTDGTASISSGSITSAVNGTFSGTVDAGTLTENSVSVATRPFAIAQAVALG